MCCDAALASPTDDLASPPATATATTTSEPAAAEAPPPAPAEPTPAPVLAPPPPSGPPLRVEALAIAADNPEAAPVVTATVTNGTPATVATVWWRTAGGDWNAAPMAGTGMRLARLPDGIQRKGFSLYLEVTDATRGKAAIASRTAPIDVKAAVEGNADRVANDARDANAMVGPHPAFVMMALGTGVLAGAGAGIYGYDLGIISARIDEVDAELAGSPSASRRTELGTVRESLQKAQVQDTAATAIFGVVAGVAIVTGTVLLVVGASEQ